MNSVGGAYGSRFAIWDLAKLHGGKPNTVGNTFPDGGTRFRSVSLSYISLNLPSPPLLQVVPDLLRLLCGHDQQHEPGRGH